MADAISNISAGGLTEAQYADRVPKQRLDRDDFIKLLVTSLTTQDPLNPQKDSEFLGQMAQLNAIETNQVMQNELQTMRANQLLGQSVQIENEDGIITGTVTAVDSIGGKPRIMVGNEPFSLSQVLRVQQPNNLNQTA